MKAVLYHFADFHQASDQAKQSFLASKSSSVVVRATPHVTTRVLAPFWLDSFADETAFPRSRRDVADAVYENVFAFLEEIRQEI